MLINKQINIKRWTLHTRCLRLDRGRVLPARRWDSIPEIWFAGGTWVVQARKERSGIEMAHTYIVPAVATPQPGPAGGAGGA